MNTITYEAVAAVRGDAAERDNELPVYYRKKELMKVQHFLQTSALIISKHRCRSYGWCCSYYSPEPRLRCALLNGRPCAIDDRATNEGD